MKGQLIPDAAEMNAQKYKNKNNFYMFLCICAIIGMVIAFTYDDIRRWAYTGSYSQMYVSFYKVSDECANTIYLHELTEDGFILIKNRVPIPPECNAELLGNTDYNIYPDMTPDEVHSVSLEIHNTLVDLSGNLVFVDRVIKYVKTDNGYLKLEDGYRIPDLEERPDAPPFIAPSKSIEV